MVVADLGGVLVALLLQDAAELPEGTLDLRPRAREQRPQLPCFCRGHPLVPLIGLGQDRCDRVLEVGLALDRVVGDADAQISNLGRQLVLQDVQRPSRVARDQHALPMREEIGDQVGDRMGLPGSWRSLHDHRLALCESLDDLPLVLVGRLGEVDLGVRVLGGPRDLVLGGDEPVSDVDELTHP